MRSADNVLSRIQTALEDAAVLPYITLQYRICEVGPQRRRWDPRELLGAVRGHTEEADHRTLSLPFEPRPRIFVDPRLTTTAAAQHAETVAAGYEARLGALTSWPRARAVRAAAEKAVEQMRLKDVTIDVWEGRGEVVGGKVMVPAPSFVARGKLRDRPIAMWVTNDLGWMHPDDERLWRFLALCLEEERFTLILARKVTIAVMALLKRTGGIALQLHNLVGPPISAARPDLARAVGDLPALLAPESIPSHRAMVKGRELLAAAGLDRHPDAALVTTATGRGFGSRPIRPSEILEWQGAEGLKMSGYWIGQMRRWERVWPLLD